MRHLTGTSKSGCPTEVALGFTGSVRVRYKRVTKESILSAKLDQRGETTNGRGDHTARRTTGSTAPGAIRNSARCGRNRGSATGSENQGAQTQATLLR